MNSFGSRLWRFVTSTRLALFLIVLLTAGSLLGVIFESNKLPVIPQLIAVFPLLENIGLLNVFTTWWYMAIVVLLLLNTAACTVAQVTRIRKPAAVNPDYDTGVSWPDGARKAKEILKRKRYRVEMPDNGNRITGEKHMFGRWASVIMHLGLVIVVLGAFLSLATKMSGEFPVYVGGTFRDVHKGYIKIDEGSLFFERHGAFELELKRFSLATDKNRRVKSMESYVTIYTNGKPVKTGTITMSRPMAVGSLTFYQYSLFGYTPSLLLTGPGNQKTPLLLLMENRGFAPNFRFTSNFILPGTDFKVSAEFFPDYNENPRSPKTRSWDIKTPALKMNVSGNGRTLFAGYLTGNESVSFEGYNLSMPRVVYWAAFKVVNDSSLIMVYTGFWTVVAGLGLLYLYVPKKVIIAEVDGKVKAGGWTQRYRISMWEEVREIIAELENKH
ncbi:MAG: cytochrome c biogenesis protein ResB [Firmicutes bacterium]|nr:cytochrome c biogenesis protein ResB [Bacillota bacterium]